MADELIYQDEDVKLLNWFQDEAMMDPDSEDQRVLSFFTVKFHYAPLFHVISDEGFYLSYVGYHGPNALDSLSRYLHGDAMFLITQCCYNNILEKTESGAELCPIEFYACGCKEKNVGEECIRKVLKSRQFEVRKERQDLSIFLATDDETNFLSIEEEYPIIEATGGILELSVTLGAMNSFGKFKVVKGTEPVWKEPHVDGKKSKAGVGGTKKAAASKKFLKASNKKEPAVDAQRSKAKAVKGLLADARKTAEAGTADKATYKKEAIADGQRSKAKAVQADARKTAANDVKGKKLLAATATEMAGKQPTADAIKSSKAKRFRNAQKVPDGNEHGGEEPSGKKAAKRSKKKSSGAFLE